MHIPRLKFILLPLILINYACEGFRTKIITPQKYLNVTKVSSHQYSSDSVKIVRNLNFLLSRHQQFFSDRSYFDSTKIIIDSIIYSPDSSRIAAFVIVKNPTYRQSIPSSKHFWYYDATCYIAQRNADSLDLYWLGFNFSNAEDYVELSETIRNAYFTEFASSDTLKSDIRKYNLNDLRFWKSGNWNKVSSDKN